MKSDDAFDSFYRKIKTDPISLLLAEWRRDIFTQKLKRIPGVVEVIASGSLAKGTQIGPVHDVDLIVVFDESKYPGSVVRGESEEGRQSAQAAITYVQKELLKQLHPWYQDEDGLPKETERRTHVVTYLGDWAGPYAEVIPSAPPVDMMPAIREGSHLLIPERGTGWIDVDPERLIRQVEQRQREWAYFKQVIGMMKAWAKENDVKISNLAIEVMVLQYCPRPRLFETLSCGQAIARMFEAADKARLTSLKDPAGRCGEIDPKIDFGKLRKKLHESAQLARAAIDAEHEWKVRMGQVATHPDVFWRELFGKKYPRPRERFWRAPHTEPWFGRYTAESGTAADFGYRRTTGFRNPKEGPDDRPPPEQGYGPAGPDDPNPRLGPRGPHSPRGAPRPGDSPRPGGRGRRGTGPVPAESAESFWTAFFGSSAAAVSVPLTFG